MGLMGLDSALSGLKLAQQQLGVISNNISNVNTEGYTRKILPQSTVAVAGESVGVIGDNIIRQVDVYLERDFWTQVSTVSALDVQASYLNRIQEFHGDPDAETTIAAQLSALYDDFALLADSPDDSYTQRTVVNQAVSLAQDINDFSSLLSEMRSDVQDDITQAVERVNGLLERIAAFNQDIKFNLAVSKSVAALEDSRDQAIKELSEEMELSFFTRGDGVMVVQTAEGVELAGDKAQELYFSQQPAGPQNYYPATLGGLYIGGNPATETTINITERQLGGNIGGLFELRDDILPQQMAEIDELAHKMALRFEQQGLTLFTDASGTVPANTDPVTANPGPLTPVEYVGFSEVIQVNPDILSDPSLVSSGTAANDVTLQSGSNEVIRRVLDYTFGNTEYMDAVGTIDLQANATGGVTMQEWLGLYSENKISGDVSLSGYSDVTNLIAASGGLFAAGTADEFTITFSDPRLVPAVADQTITISMADAEAVPIGGAVTDALDQIISEINTEIAAMVAATPGASVFAATASRGTNGELIIDSRVNMTVNGSTAGPNGLDFLGLEEGTQATTDPWFEISVGNAESYRVTIEPGDTETELMAKLEYNSTTGTGIPGLYADMDAVTGYLTLRPGNDDSNNGPVFGGDISLMGGAFTADGTGGSGVANGDTIIQALFGTDDPISAHLHSTTNAFRSSNLGPAADIDTGVIGTGGLIDYAQKMVNRQTEQVLLTEAKLSDETAYSAILETSLLDESGVNIEEELANMIVIQNSFAAAARAVSVIDEMFDDLLASI